MQSLYLWKNNRIYKKILIMISDQRFDKNKSGKLERINVDNYYAKLI
jgi:hypothetical protein